jgi:hypothetical protein
MRVVTVGLLGAVLAVGAVQAKACKLDGLTLLAQARGANADPQMAGARFRVIRQASHFRTGPDPAKGRVTTRGTIIVEITGAKGRFFVQQDYEPTSMPWVSAGSSTVEDPPKAVSWGRRARRDERKLFEPDGSFDVYSGPLAGLTLTPTNCR